MLRGRRQQRLLANSKKAEAKLGKLISIKNSRRPEANDGVIALSPCVFMEEVRGMRPFHWELDRNQQLTGRKHGLVNSGEEIRCGNAPLAGLSLNHDRRIERDDAG